MIAPQPAILYYHLEPLELQELPTLYIYLSLNSLTTYLQHGLQFNAYEEHIINFDRPLSTFDTEKLAKVFNEFHIRTQCAAISNFGNIYIACSFPFLQIVENQQLFISILRKQLKNLRSQNIYLQKQVQLPSKSFLVAFNQQKITKPFPLKFIYMLGIRSDISYMMKYFGYVENESYIEI